MKKLSWTILGSLVLALAFACRGAAPVGAVGGRSGAGSAATVDVMDLGDGWAGSSVNTVIFRHSPLVTAGDVQYAAYYDPAGHVILARRKLAEKTWETRDTGLTGNGTDAHNTISLGVDGTGIVHMAWDHHGNNLNYVHTTKPESMDLTAKLAMDGTRETQVTYPEFYALPNGDMLFLYRVGVSGNGDLVLKRYHPGTAGGEGKWETVAENLVAGEGRQNAYPEFCVDAKGTLHLGWVWRRTSDVATNHDICYAKSADGGKTWTDSAGKQLKLPITAATAEVALKVPERSDLMNQTTIAADADGHPYIVTYFRPASATDGVPQYQVVYNDGTAWKVSQVGKRTTPFTLAGGGTKRVPISRPLILLDGPRVYVIFRDAERGDRVSVATTNGIAKGDWKVADLSGTAEGSWEPSFDLERWEKEKVLDLFVQKTDQLDGGDSVVRSAAGTKVQVLEWKP